MAYKTGKPGQVIYYALNPWEERREVILIAYYKDNSDLTHPNSAIITERGFKFSTDIKNLYRSAK